VSPLRRLAIVFGVGFGLSLSLIAQVSDTPALEQRIQSIRDHILTPVVVEGQADGPKLADRMTTLRVPGVSIAVIRDGAIEWARGFGVARVGGPPVTPETLFQAASISKPVSALGVLRLVESGKLNLDTDVNQYLKTWKVPENDFTSRAKVTLRRLLSHTAGMTVHGFPGYATTDSVPTVVQVLNGTAPANTPRIFVDTTPGTAWRYSGGGYVVAQLLLEDVTGTPFARLMRESVLTPIGMTRSTFDQPLPSARLTEVATPYRSQGQPVPGGPHVYPEMAPAGLWTTPSDLARYAIEVQRSLAGKSTILSAAMAREMLTPGMNRQGLGPQTGGSRERPYFTHGGSNDGYQCILVAYNNGDGAVVMTNSDSGGQLASDIIRTIAYEYKWPDFQPVSRKASNVDAKSFDAFVGAYQLSPTAVMTVTRDGDQLFAQLTAQPRVELLSSGDREFFARTVDAQVTFETGADGKVTRLILHQNGANPAAMRLPNDDGAKIIEARTAANRRIAEQKQDSRTEGALRRLLDEVRRGQPDYTQMSAGFANAVRQQLAQMQPVMQQLGALESVSFRGVGPAGEDIYEAKFSKGSAEVRLLLAPDGKIENGDFSRQ
jgi:CubicO group peptidase (beta-lactamase class C family)